MKKIVLTLAAIAVLSTASFAAGKHGEHSRTGHLRINNAQVMVVPSAAFAVPYEATRNTRMPTNFERLMQNVETHYENRRG